jgi:hypothetical protein
MLLACLLPPHDTAAVPAVCASAVTLSDLCLCSSCCTSSVSLQQLLCTHTHAHTFLTPCSHTAIIISHHHQPSVTLQSHAPPGCAAFHYPTLTVVLQQMRDCLNVRGACM